jgi:hypothetical protein
VRGRDQSQRRAVIDRQRLAVQSVGQQDLRREQVFERQRAARAVLAAQCHQRRSRIGARLRRDHPRIEVGESHAFPAQAAHAPRRDAMEVAGLHRARQALQRIREVQDVLDTTRDLQRRRLRVRRESVGELGEAEAMKAVDGSLAGGQKGRHEGSATGMPG